MVKVNTIVLAVSAVFGMSAATAADLPGKQFVADMTNKVEEAMITGKLPSAPKEKPAEASAEAAAPAAEQAYPAVPAKYLRPDSKPAEQKQAAKDLKKAAEKTKTADANAEAKSVNTPAPVPHEYNKVAINTGAVISMKPGENVFIPISREHPNRLLTPFSNPSVISTSLSGGKKKGECGEICVRDGVIYITTDNPSAVTAFITEKGHEDIAFSVTMVPQAIPPREVRFTLPDDITDQLKRDKSKAGIRRAQVWETSQPYVETIKQAMRSVALGQVPDGYTLRNIRATDVTPSCQHRGLNIDFSNGQVMEGYNLNIYVGVITNMADVPVEFRNQNCGSWKNAAVTSWPLTVLKPGQQTEIYIAVKQEEEIAPETVRKPLITREYN